MVYLSQSSSVLTNAFHISPSHSQSHKKITIQFVLGSSSRSRKTMGIQPLSIIINKIIATFIIPPSGPFLDPKHVLSENYAPVEELPPTECLIVDGVLPPCLNGAYIRNGPNPQYAPQGTYHLFDGDGMLHCLHISNGNATLCSRYVKTNKYRVERDAGSPVFPNIISSFIHGLPAMVAMGVIYMVRYLCGQYNIMQGVGLANTSVAFFGDKLFALGESDLHYQIRVTQNGDVDTVGRHNFEAKGSPLSNMTSHRKVDCQTGETFAFQCSPMFPFLTYFRFDNSGSKQQDFPIHSMKNPAFIHDFAITKKYAVFVDIQIGMSTNLVELIAGGQSVIGVDKEKVPRNGVIPRYASDDSEMRWFNVPGLNIIHAINAWDEGDNIVLVAPNIMPVEYAIERMDLIHASVEKVTINLKTGTVTQLPLFS